MLFGVLALATVAAFYITQHLKTKNPLINGDPRADPATIDPRYAGTCTDAAGQAVSFRATKLGFYLQSKSDDVSVYVVNADGDDVATMSGSGRYIIARLNHYAYFRWNGRTYDGRYALAGTYTFRVLLQHQDRDLPIESASGAPITVTVRSQRPQPRVTGLTVVDATASRAANPAGSSTANPAGSSTTNAAASTTPDFTPLRQTLTIALAHGSHDIGANVLVYRAGPSATAPLKLVKSFGVDSQRTTASWDGLINGAPAPAGTYLVGLQVTDAACTTGRFPAVLDPAPNTTTGAGVQVSYLSASPPVTPVPAGQRAAVGVHTGGAAYRWALTRAGESGVISHGRGAGDGTLAVRLPDLGLYVLHIVSGGHRTAVPLVASGVGARAAAKVLVVLPALSWQGANPADDNGDGLVDTLGDGAQIDLDRPLVDGLPGGIADEAGLLDELDAEGRRYDLTTDVALAEGVGPSLAGRSGLLLDGRFAWLPTQLVGAFGRFAADGGGVFTDATRSLQATSQIAGGAAAPIAEPARRLARDPFGVTRGAVAPSDGELITSLTDGLDLFGTLALQFPDYQVLEPPHGTVASAAGVAADAPSIVAFHDGKGTVVEAGLPGFGASLATDLDDTDQLLARIWQAVLR